MTAIQHIDDERSASALADVLNGTRSRPVVVVTVPAGRSEPWIDVEEIARETGTLATVYLMPTGPFTWEFSNRMAEGTQVYGGAGRVYPVGHEWTSDLTKSPLRFAFNDADGERATQQLISDALRMAAAAGLVQSLPTRELRKVAGAVKIVIAGRALVDIGNMLPASIAEELTVEDTAIERIVTVGQHIEGWYDAESNRINLTKHLRPAGEALAAYNVGDVVLSKVTKVRSGKAELLLFPKTTTPAVVVPVLRADVTTNPADDLRTLLTVGEVVPARVVGPGPQWTLRLNDVDDDEPIAAAPSLLTGGPPWLIEELDEPVVDEPQPRAPLPSQPRQPTAVGHVGVEPAPSAQSTPPPARPNPAMFDRNRSRPAAQGTPPLPGPQPPVPTRTLLLKIDGLAADVARLEREAEGARAQQAATVDEREQLRYLLDQADRRANKAEHELKATRSRLRKAGNARPAGVDTPGPQFVDREQGFRYRVLTQWATRTLPSEQRDRPLSDYLVGPRFLDSLDKLEGIKEDKVADVVFEIVTGLAPQLPSREVHHLRTGSGGEDPVRIRDDGAAAWRASLQVNTPSARRIHYWVLTTGQIELARVATHDDFDV